MHTRSKTLYCIISGSKSVVYINEHRNLQVQCFIDTVYLFFCINMFMKSRFSAHRFQSLIFLEIMHKKQKKQPSLCVTAQKHFMEEAQTLNESNFISPSSLIVCEVSKTLP